MWSYPTDNIPYMAATFTDCIINNKPVAFLKLGDGEFACANRWPGRNCDQDNNTKEKGDGIIDSVRYLTSNPINVHFGLWPDTSKQVFWDGLSAKPLCWVHYHSLLIDDHDIIGKKDKLQDKITLFKTIKDSPLKKICICNELLVKSKQLLNIDTIIHIPLNNWFDTEFNRVVQSVRDNIDPNGTIFLFACGMGAKVLMTELIKIFPNGIFLDIGSGLDFICTQRNSRGWAYTYEQLKKAFEPLLPSDWDDEKYNTIVIGARSSLGVHLPK